jgi:hypothetical protein
MSNLTTTDAIIVELFDNPLTERTDDRYGRVINLASINEDTLIERAIANGFNGNAASMKAAQQALKQEAVKAVVRGEIVNFGLGHVVLDVEGSFVGDAPQWDPAIHKLAATITVSKELRETLKKTPVHVIGMAPDRAVIAAVTDVASGKVNEVLTPGGMAGIKGARIRIAGDKPGVGLFLTEQDSQVVIQIPDTAIGVNDPSKVMFVIPADLAAGSYLVSIVTQFSGNTKLPLNEPRTIAFNHLLTVE